MKFLIYTPINSPGLLAMCLKLYLPKDSLLSIDQGPGSHKLWEHVRAWAVEREAQEKDEKVLIERETERFWKYLADF